MDEFSSSVRLTMVRYAEIRAVRLVILPRTSLRDRSMILHSSLCLSLFTGEVQELSADWASAELAFRCGRRELPRRRMELFKADSTLLTNQQRALALSRL